MKTEAHAVLSAGTVVSSRAGTTAPASPATPAASPCSHDVIQLAGGAAVPFHPYVFSQGL